MTAQSKYLNLNFLLLIVVLFNSNISFGQGTVYNIDTVNNTSINTCIGTLVDDGGIAGNDGKMGGSK
jgi:hypothetical protein